MASVTLPVTHVQLKKSKGVYCLVISEFILYYLGMQHHTIEFVTDHPCINILDGVGCHVLVQEHL